MLADKKVPNLFLHAATALLLMSASGLTFAQLPSVSSSDACASPTDPPPDPAQVPSLYQTEDAMVAGWFDPRIGIPTSLRLPEAEASYRYGWRACESGDCDQTSDSGWQTAWSPSMAPVTLAPEEVAQAYMRSKIAGTLMIPLASADTLEDGTSYEFAVQRFKGDGTVCSNWTKLLWNTPPDFGIESTNLYLTVNADGSTTAIDLATLAASSKASKGLTYSLSGTGANKFAVANGTVSYTGSGESTAAQNAFTLTLTADNTLASAVDTGNAYALREIESGGTDTLTLNVHVVAAGATAPSGVTATATTAGATGTPTDTITVNPGDTVTLTGNCSSCPAASGNPNYSWMETDSSGTAISSTVELQGADSSTATFTAVNTPNAQPLYFQFSVTNAADTTTSSIVTVNVTNNAPMNVFAGEDRNTAAAYRVTLAGTAEDDAGDTLTYVWQQVTGEAANAQVVSSGDTGYVSLTEVEGEPAKRTFTAPASAGGTSLYFRLTVTDLGDTEGTDTVAIRVLSNDVFPQAATCAAGTMIPRATLPELTMDADGNISVRLPATGPSLPPVPNTGPEKHLVAWRECTGGDCDPEAGSGWGDWSTPITLTNPATDTQLIAAAALDFGATYEFAYQRYYDGSTEDLCAKWIKGTATKLIPPVFSAADKTAALSPLTLDQNTEDAPVDLPFTPENSAQAGTVRYSLSGEDADRFTLATTEAGSLTLSYTGSVGVGEETLSLTMTADNTFMLPQTEMQISDYGIWERMTLSGGGTDSITIAVKVIHDRNPDSTLPAYTGDADAGPETNRPPTAEAGDDQRVQVGQTVILDGSASKDPDGDAVLTYSWQEVNDAIVPTQDPENPARASFIAPDISGDLVFILTVTDQHGAFGRDAITVTVEPNYTEITQTVLTRQALAMAIDINSALSERLDAVTSGHASMLAPDGSSFAMALADDKNNNGIGIWGQFDNRNLSDSSASGSWQGESSSRHLGFDWRLNNRGLAGLLISETEDSFSYTDRLIGGGIIQSNLSGQHPYFGWTFDNGIRLWAALGFGSGSLTVLARQAATRSDTSLATTLVGIGRDLTSGGAVNIGIRGEFTSAALDIDASEDGRIDAVQTFASQFRVTATGRMPIKYRSGARLTPGIDLALRNDSGDGATGTGLELGIQLNYVSAGGLLTISGGHRTMLTDLGDYEESGTQLSIRLDTAKDGRGLAFTLQPGYGRTQSGAERIWSDNLTELSERSPSEGEKLSTELSYGVAMPGKRAMLLTPYGRWQQDASGQQRLEYGTRLDVGERFQLSFGGTEQYDIRGRRDQSTGLTGEMRF